MNIVVHFSFPANIQFHPACVRRFLITLLYDPALCVHSSATLSPSQKTDGFKFFEVDELERFMLNAGFADVKVKE